MALGTSGRSRRELLTAALVVKGRGAMPGFTDLLSPVQIANVVNYIRTHFGNSYAKPAMEADVAQIEGTRPLK